MFLPLVMHIPMLIHEFSALIPHKIIIPNVVIVHTTRWNLECAVSFWLQKTNHTMYLTTGERNGDYRIHIYSIATYAQLNKKCLWGSLLRDNIWLAATFFIKYCYHFLIIYCYFSLYTATCSYGNWFIFTRMRVDSEILQARNRKQWRQ